MPDRRTYFLQTLGCPKNQVDASYIEGLMDAGGYAAVAAPEEADVAIVHTCGFIEVAAQESVDALLELSTLKERNPGMTLVASGCLAQRHGRDLAAEMPELDVVIGTRDWPALPSALEEARGGRQVVRVEELRPVDYSNLEFSPTAPATTYIKLSDGCNFRCAFCTIPSFTGNLRSKPVEVIVEEVRRCVAEGSCSWPRISPASAGIWARGARSRRCCAGWRRSAPRRTGSGSCTRPWKGSPTSSSTPSPRSTAWPSTSTCHCSTSIPPPCAA